MLNMDMKKIQELPTPEDLKKEFPLPYKVQKLRNKEIKKLKIFLLEKIDRLIFNYWSM